jgi:uncharacterized protein (DUF488 family)
MIIYTIGFTKKRAETFFELLKSNGIQRLVDIRINPGGQLAGFAQQDDLPYLLKHLAGGCQYVHIPELAPTKVIMKAYRTNGNWPLYEVQFINLLDERNIPDILDRSAFENQVSCLLCSESTPEHCHRRIVAERLASCWPEVEIRHI